MPDYFSGQILAAAIQGGKLKARDPKAPISIWNFEGRQRRQQATRASPTPSAH